MKVSVKRMMAAILLLSPTLNNVLSRYSRFGLTVRYARNLEKQGAK